MNNRILKTSVLAVAIQTSILSSSAWAAGFYLHEHSSNGLGRAFAGQAAMPENATVLYSNAAAITAFDKATTSLFVSHVDPGIDVKGSVTLNTPMHSVTVDASQSNVSDGAFIPALFYVQPLAHNLSFGIGVYSNFGLSTDFDDNYNALHFADRAEIKSVNVNPTVAYKYSDTLSFGFGVNINHTEAELGTSVSNLISTATSGAIAPNSAIAKMDGDDWGVSWNLGVFWMPSTETSVGLSYRSNTKLTLSGDLESDVLPTLNQGGDLDLELPDMAELAINQQLTHRLSIQASINWFGWSSFDVLEANLDDGSILLIGEEHFEDNWKYSIGTTYKLNELWVLRAGYAYDEGAATNEHRSLNIPDTDREWFSAGATYSFNEEVNLDLGLLNVRGKDSELEEQTTFGSLSSSLHATQSSSATIISAQINYSF